MGFRLGWWGKRFGTTWGSRGGLRLYGMTGGGRRKTGCLIPFLILVSGGTFVLMLVLQSLR